METYAPAQAPAPIHEFLRNRLRAAYDDNLTRMGEAIDATPSMVRKWTSEDPRLQTVPGPKSCWKIARGLGVDVDYVLSLAGHRVEVPVYDFDPDLALVNAAWPRLDEGIRRAIQILVGAVSGPAGGRISGTNASRTHQLNGAGLHAELGEQRSKEALAERYDRLPRRLTLAAAAG